MRAFNLFSFVALALLPSLCHSLPFYLQQIGVVNVSGSLQPLIVRDEAFSVNGSINAIPPGTAAVNVLNQINHFIILTFNSESFDSIMGGFIQANSLANPSYTPPYNKQIQRPANFTGTPAYPSLANASVYFTLPGDQQATLPYSLPNAPVLFNQYLKTTQAVSAAPNHGYEQAQYQVDGGKMDGFTWSAGVAGANAVGHWNLTGSTLYNLASQFTLFDNFFSSAFGGALLSHLYLIGGRSVPWDNGNSQPPLVLSDNSTLAYHNYSVTDGLLVDLSQSAPVSYPNNSLINDLHPYQFCSPPYFPLINDASNTNSPANVIDQLLSASVSWGYYTQDWTALSSQAFNSSCTTGNASLISPTMNPLPYYTRFNRLTSPESSHLQDLDAAFFSKLHNGTLESVVWVQPNKNFDFGGGTAAPATSDAWLNSTMQAIFASPHWGRNDTAVLITFAGSSGFYDHVPPYAGDVYGPGVRVPLVMISPYHRGGGVNSQRYEHLSVVKMIQTRFGLPQTGGQGGFNPLMGQARDQAARDLGNSFNEGAAGNVTHPANAGTRWGVSRWVVGIFCCLLGVGLI